MSYTSEKLFLSLDILVEAQKYGSYSNLNESLEPKAGVQTLMRFSVIPHKVQKLPINRAFKRLEKSYFSLLQGPIIVLKRRRHVTDVTSNTDSVICYHCQYNIECGTLANSKGGRVGALDLPFHYLLLILN